MKVIKKVFYDDVVTFLMIHTKDFCISQCVSSVATEVKKKNVNFQNNLMTFYSVNIKKNIDSTSLKEVREINRFNVMSGMAIDQNVKQYVSLLTDYDLSFMIICALIDLWSESKVCEITFGDLIQCFNEYMRYRIITSVDFSSFQKSFCYDLMRKTKSISNLKEGRKIIDLIDFFSSAFKDGENKQISLIISCIIASGAEEYMLPFLWYARFTLLFPQFLRGKWRRSFNLLNSVKDNLFVDMATFDNRLMMFINMYFYDNRSSPLCD